MSWSAGLASPPLCPEEREGLLGTVQLKYLFPLPSPPAAFVKALKGSLVLQKSTLSIDPHLTLTFLWLHCFRATETE